MIKEQSALSREIRSFVKEDFSPSFGQLGKSLVVALALLPELNPLVDTESENGQRHYEQQIEQPEMRDVP